MTEPNSERSRAKEEQPKPPEQAPETESRGMDYGYKPEDLTPERMAEVREAAARSRTESLQTLRDRFERPKDRADRLLFHSSRHSVGVGERTRDIAALQVSNADKAKMLETLTPEEYATAIERIQTNAEILALDHDRVNTSVIVEVEDPDAKHADGTPIMRKVRKRSLKPEEVEAREDRQKALEAKKAKVGALGGEALTPEEADFLENFKKVGISGTNETKSADESEAKLQEARGADGSPLFRKDGVSKDETFAATVPGWDKQNNTVEQIHLSAETSLTDRSIALSDLGEAGHDPDAYILAADPLLLEDYPDIEEAVRNPEKLDEQTKLNVAQRIVEWSKSQISFAEGRKARIEGYEKEVAGADGTKEKKIVSDLDGSDEDVKERMKAYFNKFDESIARARAVYEKRLALFSGEKSLDEAFEELRQLVLDNLEKYAEPV